jgi:deazaflavin-dependent oxidoreductase (nitroreductase family)
MKNLWIKSFMTINTWLIRASGGRIAANLGTQTILLLHTTGRRSGKKTITPIAYFYLDDVFFVVASNWGKESQAAWYHNLKANPRVGIEVKGTFISVLSREALDDEYTRLWSYATEHHPPYLDYQKMTTRRIPIIVFVPVAR